MSDYSRFISYLHFYKNGIKGTSAGHARIEIKQELCKTSVRVKCNDAKDGVLDAFYYIRDQRNGNKLQVMKIGTITITKGEADVCFETTKYNLFHSTVSFDQIQGILFCIEPGTDYLAADWEEKTLYPDDVASIYTDKRNIQNEQEEDRKARIDKKYYEKMDPLTKTEWISSESIETIPFEPLQKNIVNDQTIKTFEPPQFMEANKIEQDLFLSVPNVDKKMEPQLNFEALSQFDPHIKEAQNTQYFAKTLEQTNIINSDIEPTTSKNIEPITLSIKSKAIEQDALNMFFEKKATEQMEVINQTTKPQAIEQADPLNAFFEKKATEPINTVNSFIKPEISEKLETQNIIFEQIVEQTETINSVEQKTQQMPENQNVEKIPQDSIIKASQVQTQDLKGGANLPPNCYGRRMPWEDTQEARDILNNNLKMYPFQDGEIAECVKIEPKDIGKLPVEFWTLGNNSFLLHSYCNYKYLMFAKRMNRLKCEYLLMIPGIYQQREKLMAKMFGFDYFKCANCREQRPGEFGYWYMIINF